jgi:hypothetical protein
LIEAAFFGGLFISIGYARVVWMRRHALRLPKFSIARRSLNLRSSIFVKTTPAMAPGVVDRAWAIGDLIDAGNAARFRPSVA